MRDVLSSTFRVLINVGKVYQHVAKEQTEPAKSLIVSMGGLIKVALNVYVVHGQSLRMWGFFFPPVVWAKLVVRPSRARAQGGSKLALCGDRCGLGQEAAA